MIRNVAVSASEFVLWEYLESSQRQRIRRVRQLTRWLRLHSYQTTWTQTSFLPRVLVQKYTSHDSYKSLLRTWTHACTKVESSLCWRFLCLRRYSTNFISRASERSTQSELTERTLHSHSQSRFLPWSCSGKMKCIFANVMFSKDYSIHWAHPAMASLRFAPFIRCRHPNIFKVWSGYPWDETETHVHNADEFDTSCALKSDSISTSPYLAAFRNNIS